MKLNGSISESLTFNVSLAHVNKDKLRFFFRINCEGIEYGFKGDLTAPNEVKIPIPPLADILNKSEAIECFGRLDISDGTYIVTPWESNVFIDFESNLANAALSNVKQTKHKADGISIEVTSTPKIETETAESVDSNSIKEEGDDKVLEKVQKCATELGLDFSLDKDESKEEYSSQDSTEEEIKEPVWESSKVKSSKSSFMNLRGLAAKVDVGKINDYCEVSRKEEVNEISENKHKKSASKILSDLNNVSKRKGESDTGMSRIKSLLSKHNL